MNFVPNITKYWHYLRRVGQRSVRTTSTQTYTFRTLLTMADPTKEETDKVFAVLKSQKANKVSMPRKSEFNELNAVSVDVL